MFQTEKIEVRQEIGAPNRWELCWQRRPIFCSWKWSPRSFRPEQSERIVSWRKKCLCETRKPRVFPSKFVRWRKEIRSEKFFAPRNRFLAKAKNLRRFSFCSIDQTKKLFRNDFRRVFRRFSTGKERFCLSTCRINGTLTFFLRFDSTKLNDNGKNQSERRNSPPVDVDEQRIRQTDENSRWLFVTSGLWT